MKRILIGVASLMLAVQSCNVLDVNPLQQYSETTAYASIENMDLYVKGFYGLLYANSQIQVDANCLMDDGATELVKYSWFNVAGGTMNKFFYQTNFVTPESNFRSNWNDMYTRIRQFNEYLYDMHNNLAGGLDPDQVAIRTAEVRFLRAFAYQELILRHGGVILRINENSVDDQNQKAKARSSEAECWDFVISEFKEAAKYLPEVWTDGVSNNVGRVTKGAAWGMIARSSLYAKRYDEAIAACDTVLALKDKGIYELLPGTTAADYQNIFNVKNNKELIIPVYYETAKKQHAYDMYFCPPYDYMAAGVSASIGAAAAPTDEYASSFDINVGGSWQAFDWANLGTYTSGPWANRDPRFYASILYNGATWKGRTLELFVDGKDGYMDFTTAASQDNVHKSTTGYLFRKFMKNDASINYSSILSDQYWIEMRLAEIYFIRSEAYAYKNNYASAYADLNIIRDRVGMPALTQKGSIDDYIADLSKEKICEMGLEGQHYFDLIRWDKAVSTLNNQKMHGVKITKSGATYTYTKVECDTQGRFFPQKYTIFPIPAAEIKNNTLCIQNDVWK